MARIRTIKPEFWGDAKTARVSRDARLLMIGLLNESDDDGRQLASAKRIAGALFPHDDDVDAALVSRWLDELEAAGFVMRYEVDGAKYLVIPSFRTHQRISKPTESRLPPPPVADPLRDDSATECGVTPPTLRPVEDIVAEPPAMEVEVDLGSGSGTGNPPGGAADAARPDSASQLVTAYVRAYSARRHGNPPPGNLRGAAGKVFAGLLAEGYDFDDLAKVAHALGHEGKHPGNAALVLGDLHAEVSA